MSAVRTTKARGDSSPPFADELWRILDEDGPHPGRGWQLYLANFQHERTVRRGGRAWKVRHLLMAGDLFRSWLTVETGRMSMSEERRLRAARVFDFFGSSALHIGHRGGWSLRRDRVDGSWMGEYLTAQRAFEARNAIDALLTGEPRWPVLRERALPVTSYRERTRRIWDFRARMRADRAWRERLFAVGYVRRNEAVVDGRKWNVLRFVVRAEEMVTSSVQLSPVEWTLTAEHRRRISAAARKLPFRAQWPPVGPGPWLLLYRDHPTEPAEKFSDIRAELDALPIRDLVK